MVRPTRTRERSLRRQGFRRIAGTDEAGRGALAGPLVAAAVILPDRYVARGLTDSKLLTARAREQHATRIMREALAWSVHVEPPEHIDTYGVQRTNLDALTLAVSKLHERPDFVLVDAWTLTLPMPTLGIIHGDQRELAIAAASVIAKVFRDRLMTAIDPLYPAYGFRKHKGYGTAQHRRSLTRYGLSAIHRRTFIHP